MRIRIESDGGLDRAKLWMRSMGRNATNLRPLGYKARERWHQSEERLFVARPGWNRKASTERRYRYPVKTLNGTRMGRAKRKGPGYFTGGLQRGLTRPHQRGIKDQVISGRGKLALDVGVKGGRNPRAYGRWLPFDVVNFDGQARQELARDTRQHLVSRRRR